MFFCCECCVLSGRDLWDELITRPEEFYRLWCFIACDLETSRMRRPWPALGRSATGKKFYYKVASCWLFLLICIIMFSLRQMFLQVLRFSPSLSSHLYNHSFFCLLTLNNLNSWQCLWIIHPLAVLSLETNNRENSKCTQWTFHSNVEHQLHILREGNVANVSKGMISLYPVTQDVPFIAAPTTVTWTHSKPTSAVTAPDCFSARDSDKRRTLY